MIFSQLIVILLLLFVVLVRYVYIWLEQNFLLDIFFLLALLNNFSVLF